jgi:hypothetical protein
MAWVDIRSGDVDIYAQAVDRFGNVLWAANGVPVCTVANTQQQVALASDGGGGAWITWIDIRNTSTSWDVYAAHIDAAGVENRSR